MFFRFQLKVSCLIVIVVFMMQLTAVGHQHDNEVHFMTTHSHFGDSSHVHFDHFGRSAGHPTVNSAFGLLQFSILDGYVSYYKSAPISSIDRPPEFCI